MTDHDLSEEVEERFQVLENKIGYQERTVEELNAVVIRQQEQIDSLLLELSNVRAIISGEGERTIDAAEEPPPPHY